MKISKVEAFAIKIPRDDRFSENLREDDLNDFGDYVISRRHWTSIYPKHVETTLVRIETDTGICGAAPVLLRMSRYAVNRHL